MLPAISMESPRFRRLAMRRRSFQFEPALAARKGVLFIAAFVMVAISFSAAASKPPSRFEAITEVPAQADWVDLAGDGAATGRASSGASVFTPGSMEALDYDRGRIRVDSRGQSLELTSPATELVVQVDGGRAGTVVEITALAGDYATGSLLYALDGKPREGVLLAVNGRMGIRTREPFTRI